MYLRRAFKTFGAFTSGIGIHYAESTIVNAKHQSVAKNLIIGQRMPPQVIVRAADARAYELQDLLPSDARFKILVFAGDTANPAQRAKVEKLVGEGREGRGGGGRRGEGYYECFACVACLRLWVGH